jgi:hypothetical protein
VCGDGSGHVPTAPSHTRDPYNDWDVLWKFGLSWWGDVIPMLDEDNRLSVAQIKSLLAKLHERENVFALKLAVLPAKEQEYFRKRYAALEKFLNRPSSSRRQSTPGAKATAGQSA